MHAKTNISYANFIFQDMSIFIILHYMVKLLPVILVNLWALMMLH